MHRSRFWPPFILICLLEALLALVTSLRAGDSGLSFWLVMGAFVLINSALMLLFIASRNADWRARWLEPSARPNFFRTLQIAAPLLALTFGLLLFLLRYLNPEITSAYYARFWPVLAYLFLISSQTSLCLLWLQHGFHPIPAWKNIFFSTGVAFGIFIIVWIIIAATGLGITKDPSYWGEPGVPILGWQFALSLIAGFCAFLYFTRRDISPRTDIIIALVIWALAFGLWMSVPLSTLQNSFYAPIQPPYDQPFPSSDASVYDLNAQSLLLGQGFATQVPPRPLFILFLAGLHVLFGQEYARVVFGQTLILALFPVALYFLGKNLHSRTAGLVAALFAIFREVTSLWVSSDARVSNTKMLLSDFLTTLVLVAFLLIVLRWYQTKRRSLFMAFAVGALLGLQILLRSQSLFIAPGILLLALPIYWPDWRRWVAQSVLFALGLLIGVAPWLARNYGVIGQVSLDDPAQIVAVASMYSGGTPTSNNELFADMSPSEVSDFVLQTILHKPGYVAGFVSNQFLANEIDTLLVLPIFARYDGLSAPVHLYWYEWDGHPAPLNIALFIIYLAVIALGIGAAWSRLRWAGLLPIVFHLSYVFSTSLARYSGWRYVFPADWVGYFYFALGFVELLGIAARLFGADTLRALPAPEADSVPRDISPLRAIALLGVILLIGNAPRLTETGIHAAVPICETPIAECLSAAELTSAQIQNFLSQPDALALSGQVFYPRYFSRGNGLPSTNPVAAYAPRNYPRIGFTILLDGSVLQAILPMKGARPFPNAQGAIILGCQQDRYVEVRLIYFPETGEIFTNGSLMDPCENL